MSKEKTKICGACMGEFPRSAFYPIKNVYLTSYCKPCVIKRSAEFASMHPEKRREYTKRARDKERGTEWGRAGQICETMQQRSRKRGWPRPEFSREEIYEIISGGKCEKTGITFDCQILPGSTRNPWTPSPDRIDPSRPYTKDNVQWVCAMYNFAKQEWTDEEVMRMARELVNQNGDF